jgi:hypothetical protein
VATAASSEATASFSAAVKECHRACRQQ